MPELEDVVALRALPEADRLPTLTEVVELASDPWAPPAALAWAPESSAAPAPVIEAPAPVAEPAQVSPIVVQPADEEAIMARVLAALEQRLDGVFEVRLREALAPALARAADGLIRELRPELTQALHEMVHEAVKRALQDVPPR